jgi:hypothetical protein
MNKDILFSLWYDSLEGTKTQGFAYKAWCAGWDAAVLAEREACAKAMQPMLRDMISRSQAAEIIRGRTE